MSGNASRRDLLAGATTLVAGVLGAGSVRALAQSAPKDKLQVKIINSYSTTELAFERLLDKQGYLEEMGVSVTTQNVSDGTKVLASLIAGEMDICMKSGFGQVLPAIQRGAAVRVVAGANMLTPQFVLTNNPAIRTVADLKGKKIGTGPIGALEQQLMVAILLKHGVDSSDVTFVNVGSTSDIFRAISAGVVDGGPVNIDVFDRLKGNLRIIAHFWSELREYPYQASFTSVASMQRKPEALIRVMAAYCKLYRFLRTPESKQPYVDAYVSAVGGSASDGAYQWQFLYDNKVFATDLLIPDSSLEFIQNLNLKTNVQKAAMPLGQIADFSLAKQAVQRLA